MSTTSSYKYKRTASGLSQIEKFAFSLIRSATCHSLCMPVHRYGTILQVKKTMLEIQDASDWEFKNMNFLTVFDVNSAMAIYYRTCLLLTSHGTAQIFKEKIKRKINVQRTDQRYIRIIKRVSFSTLTRLITFSFGHYFSLMQSLSSINKLPPNRQWRFGFTQRGFTMLCITTIIDQLLWYSSYYLFAPYVKKTMHSKIRTYASNFMIHPLYSIMRRQMITNENIYDATKGIIQNYGFLSLFDGALCEIFRSIIYDISGKTFDLLLKKYVLWKYDVYGIKNTLILCKEYVDIIEKDNILCHGYIRQCMQELNEAYCANIYIPKQLKDLIANKFYHEEEYDILNVKLRKFVFKLSTLKATKRNLAKFLCDEQLKNNVKNLFQDRKFQKLWKNKIVNEMQTNLLSQQTSTVNNRFNCYYFGSKNIIFYCDLCANPIESKRMCRFKSCGHCLCSSCRRKLRIKRKCGVCQEKFIRNKNYYYLIPKIAYV